MKFTITESEREQIRGLYEQVARPSTKPVAKPTQGNNDWELLKELLNNYMKKVPMYVSKALPGKIIINDFKNPEMGYKQNSSYQWRHVTVYMLTYDPKTKSSGFSSVTYYTDDTSQNILSQDINQFAQDINQKPPTGGIKHYGDQMPAIGKIESMWCNYIVQYVDPSFALNVLKQVDPNVGQYLTTAIEGLINTSLNQSEKQRYTKYITQLNQIMGVSPQQPNQVQPTPQPTN